MWQKPHIRLYIIVLVACLAGAGWLLVQYWSIWPHMGSVCMVKNVTGLPCPACGSSRAATLLLQGSPWHAITTNPIGVLLTCLLPFCLAWILRDLYTGKQDFYRFYRRMERFFQKRIVALVAILLVLANWAWNIAKDL